MATLTKIETREELITIIHSGKFKSEVAKYIPDETTRDRFLQNVCSAPIHNPDILQCTTESICRAALRAAEMNLSCSGVDGRGYLVPLNCKVKMSGQDIWFKKAVFIPGYLGLKDIAISEKACEKIDARVVYEGDEFEIKFGDDESISHRPTLDPKKRGNMIGAYMVATLANGAKVREWMPAEDIEKIRSKSNGKNSLMWTTYPEEGYRKTVIRRGCKHLPYKERLGIALQASDQEYTATTEPEPTASLESPPPSRTKQLEDKLSPEQEPVETEVVDPEPAEKEPATGRVADSKKAAPLPTELQTPEAKEPQSGGLSFMDEL